MTVVLLTVILVPSPFSFSARFLEGSQCCTFYEQVPLKIPLLRNSDGNLTNQTNAHFFYIPSFVDIN